MPGVQQSCGDTPVVAFLCKAPLRTSIEDFMPDKEGDSQQKPPAADASPKKKRVSLHSVLFSMKKLFWAKPCKIFTEKSHLVYTTTENSATEANPEYRVLFSRLQGSMTDKLLIRTDISTDLNTTEIFMEKVSDKTAIKWKRWSEIKILMEQLGFQNKQKQITPFEMQKMLDLLSQRDTLWRESIMWLADDTGLKDRRLINIALAAAMPIPIKHIAYQKYNSHTLLYTNAHTGKTATIYNIIGKIGATAFTESGLVGGGNKGNENEGALNGTGCYPAEETTGGGIKVGEQVTPMMEYLLNYMVNGVQDRDISSQPRCKGTKALVFIGNMTEREADFHNIMRRIMYLHDNDKHGRRIALICVDDAMQEAREEIMLSDTQEDLKLHMREVLRVFLKEYETNIWKFIKKSTRQWQTIDRDYIDRVMELASKTTDEPVYNLLKGHTHSTIAIRFSALKVFIMLNLVGIAKRQIKTLEGQKLSEYEKIYTSLKEMNLKSIDGIVGADERMQKLLDWITNKHYSEEQLFRLSAEDNNELQGLLKVGERQIRNIVRKYRNMKSGIRRI